MSVVCNSQVVLEGDHLLQFKMVRDSSDAYLCYPTRYTAEDNATFDVNIRLNRYIAQTQVWKRRRDCLEYKIIVILQKDPWRARMSMRSPSAEYHVSSRTG